MEINDHILVKCRIKEIIKRQFAGKIKTYYKVTPAVTDFIANNIDISDDDIFDQNSSEVHYEAKV